jgi:hypothetical protein
MMRTVLASDCDIVHLLNAAATVDTSGKLARDRAKPVDETRRPLNRRCIDHHLID